MSYLTTFSCLTYQNKTPNNLGIYWEVRKQYMSERAALQNRCLLCSNTIEKFYKLLVQSGMKENSWQ